MNRYRLPKKHWDSLSEQDRALVRACHTFGESADRWAHYRDVGLENKPLMERIKFEFGSSGYSGGPGIPSIWTYGSSSPAFWWSPGGPTTKPDEPNLKGAKLRNEVRRVLMIPYPIEQLKLF